jgi:cyanate permease
MGVFVFASGLGPTIMGVCYDITHSYHLALAAFAAALLIAILLISRLGPYAFPIRQDPGIPQASPAAIPAGYNPG